MPISITDRMFWLRVGFGVATGTLTQLLFDDDYQTGILFGIVMYMVTYYIVRRAWGPRLKPEETNKLYTAGLGSYVLLFLFFWIFLFTVGLHFLHL